MEVIEFLQSFSSDFLNSFMIFITSFGSLYVLMFFVCVIYWCYNKEIGYKMAIIMSCSGVLNNFVKGLVQSSRPIGVEGIFSIEEFSATGYSFPSGHAMTITTFGLLLIFFLWQSKLSKSKKILGSIFLGLLILLVCLSRVYLGVHYASDILAGFLLGSAFSLFCYYFYLHQKKLS